MNFKRRLTHEEWKAEGTALFGPDFMQWRFVCPICKNVASVEQFRNHKDQGATPDCAPQNCIGRYMPKEERGGFSSDKSNPKVKKPCDYAAYGFFKLAPVEVEFSDGSVCGVFAFDEGAAP